MISIDHASRTPIRDQLREQLRFRIASGHFKVNETLPSTRRLGQLLEISFHTVRKVYQELEREGLLEARPGRGFVVRQPSPLAKPERLERGAELVQEMLRRLIGVGLSEGEIEYLIQEQFSLLEATGSGNKLVAALPYREMSEQCAEQIQQNLQQPVEPVLVAEVSRHQDADFVFVVYADVKDVMDQVPRSDVIGIVTYLAPEVLERVSRLTDRQTLGVVTRDAEAIPPLAAELRTQTSFSGQVIAASIDEGSRDLEHLVGQMDLIVYTPPCKRRLRPYLTEERRHVSVSSRISPDSLQTIRQSVPA